jgi:hypothetical protein
MCHRPVAVGCQLVTLWLHRIDVSSRKNASVSVRRSSISIVAATHEPYGGELRGYDDDDDDDERFCSIAFARYNDYPVFDDKV